MSEKMDFFHFHLLLHFTQNHGWIMKRTEKYNVQSFLFIYLLLIYYIYNLNLNGH